MASFSKFGLKKPRFVEFLSQPVQNLNVGQNMTTPESDRLREIDRAMRKLKRRHDKAYAEWEIANKERMDLQTALRELAEERERLAQGQLLFDGEDF